jgi:DNA-binding response OmpR family regulator
VSDVPIIMLTERKIEHDPAQPRLIETVRGFGYRYRSP